MIAFPLFILRIYTVRLGHKPINTFIKIVVNGTPLGMGTAPVAEVYAKAVEMGLPMVVESETLTPDGITEAQICIDYLKSQEA